MNLNLSVTEEHIEASIQKFIDMIHEMAISGEDFKNKLISVADSLRGKRLKSLLKSRKMNAEPMDLFSYHYPKHLLKNSSEEKTPVSFSILLSQDGNLAVRLHYLNGEGEVIAL